MSLRLYYHPLSSFCWKVLIALYENETPFTPVAVNLGNPVERAALPIRATHPNLAAYLDRLRSRPSFARVIEEAEPYFHPFPAEPAAPE
ncbi:MAG: glutathione S-transferase family protein [Rhodopseudomonas sp.]|nr:glutathione S-transferase family protein [Rhodopseudomonas sp.]